MPAIFCLKMCGLSLDTAAVHVWSGNVWKFRFKDKGYALVEDGTRIGPSRAIFHEGTIFVLKPEISEKIVGMLPFLRTPASTFSSHLNDVHPIFHQLRAIGTTVSVKKFFVAVPEVIILGHKCNY